MDSYPQTPFTMRDSWPPGTVVKDDYVIESRLGKGGFGTVYKAKHRFLQSDHVIKRLHEEYSSDEVYVQKFIAEGQVIRRLKECPFIVAVEHMTLTADQHLILIMEFMSGGDLNHLMQARPFFTIPEVAGFAVQIAEGLRAAHAIDLIHRDVKPANVLLAENKRRAKLTDFGIAADHQSSQATSVVRGGSLGYAAPEQWTTSGRNLDGRTDIYALGVTMYQMLTQVMPYQASDIGAWIEAVRMTAPLHTNRLREDVPEDINRLVMQMIEVRREHRPPNVESILDALRPYADPNDWNRSSTLRVPERTFQPGGPTTPGHATTQFQPPPPTYQPPLAPPPPPPQPPQQQWTQPPPSVMPPPPIQKAGGGAGKWLLIVPLWLGTLGGGGWFGWKQLHPGGGGGGPVIKEETGDQTDWIKKGNEARVAKDYHEAVKCYRQVPAGAASLAAVQGVVESEVEAEVTKFSDLGQFDHADALVTEWLVDFPGSARLTAQKTLIARRRAAQ